MTKLFGHGDLRLYLLSLLADQPRHGYEIIVDLEGRFLGLYSPSPGTIYPRLAALEEEGLLTSEEVDGRRVYRITEAGRRELAQREEELREIGRRIASSARELAREIRNEVGESVRGLREELRLAARDAAAQQRRLSRQAREEARQTRENVRRTARDARDTQARLARDVGALQADLRAFVSDVADAARRHSIDRERLHDLRDLLTEMKAAVIELFERGPVERPARREPGRPALREPPPDEQ